MFTICLLYVSFKVEVRVGNEALLQLHSVLFGASALRRVHQMTCGRYALEVLLDGRSWLCHRFV